MTRLLSALALAAGVVFASADDKEKPKKAPDWSGYAPAGDVAGVVVAADEKSVTLQLSKVVPGMPSGRSRKGGGGKVEKTDHEFAFATDGMVRWKKLPPKLGSDGQKVPYTPSEMEKLKQPQGATGYAADRSELKPGHIVDLVLVRPKSVPANKATADDLEIKYAVILGEAAVPPKPGKKDGDEKKGAEKKDK